MGCNRGTTSLENTILFPDFLLSLWHSCAQNTPVIITYMIVKPSLFLTEWRNKQLKYFHFLPWELDKRLGLQADLLVKYKLFETNSTQEWKVLGEMFLRVPHSTHHIFRVTGALPSLVRIVCSPLCPLAWGTLLSCQSPWQVSFH